MHGRLVGGQGPDAEDTVVLDSLRALVPALSGLLNTLSNALPRRQAA